MVRNDVVHSGMVRDNRVHSDIVHNNGMHFFVLKIGVHGSAPNQGVHHAHPLFLHVWSLFRAP